MQSAASDYAVRAVTDDGSFRVIVARTTETVRTVTEVQRARGETAKSFGDLLTAAVLFRETMSPGLRVQAILKGTGSPATLVADSAPAGYTRGLLQGADGNPIVAREGSLLQVMRTLHNGSINQGVVRVPPGGGISQAMMAYMHESEQVDTMLAVATVLGPGGEPVASGGYMVQLLPEVGRGPLAVMAERLEDFRTIDHLITADFSPEWLREELLYGMPFTALERTEISASCWCSESRLLGAIATLSKAEIRSMLDDGTPLEITCDYCKKEYAIQPSVLSGLVASN